MTDGTDKDNGDYLGYGVYADTLWSRIQAALDKDQGKPEELGDDPLVVGIFGEWGAGKSTLLKLVRRRAEAAAEQASEAQENVLTVPVYFQPWKYEHEKHLLVPLVLHVVAAAREALKESPTIRQQLALLSKDADRAVGNVASAVHKSAKTARKWFPVVKKIVGSLSVFGVSVALPDEIDDWLKDAEAVFESPETKEQQRKASAKELRAKKLSFVDNGFHYYELHELLAALTRPGKTAETEDLTAQGVHTKNLRINFVIFIDDLDRCLPEKAVETLELIKTVFNLESFAFVLALDEEVVERGIGHRYMDYALLNKKPEMPITGFEYLEKIVHLPFRLPGLNRDQARRFLEQYESEEVVPDQPEKWWFASRPVVDEEAESWSEKAMLRRSERRTPAPANLCSLVLNAFTAYVPRKLVRLVELLHQVQEVASLQGKVLSAASDSDADVRVVAALTMFQLFQPDLYRLFRRKPQAFPLLLAAFAKRSGLGPEFREPDISDVDLWLWVVDESAGDSNEWIQTASTPDAINAVVHRISKTYSVVTDQGQPLRFQTSNEDGEEVFVTEFDVAKTRAKRSRAQNVKLPLIAQIVEHRAAQRHAFDPLRLFHALAGALEQGWDATQSGAVSPAAEVRISDYFELMIADGSMTEPHRRRVTTAVSGAWSVEAPINTQPVRYLDRLFADITSDQPEVQTNLVANNELEFGKYLETEAAKRLLSRLGEWIKGLGNEDLDESRTRLARGLKVIASLIPRELGKEFLGLVDDASSFPFYVPGRPLLYGSAEQVQQEADRADLWSALGTDDRFDAKRFYLPKSRLFEKLEPIPGFVRVFADEVQSFQPFLGKVCKTRAAA